MSDHSVRPSTPKPKRSASSGQHPAVRAYRKKLESIDESATAAVSDLDRRLQEFLDDVKTPVPKEPPDD